jgi:RNA polymerase sigma-70 factor, ECF subfamily
MGDETRRTVDGARRRHASPAAGTRVAEAGGSGTPRALDPDRDLIDAVRNGDVAGAVPRLLERHGAAVYRYCREALRDPVLADDVHQQVFIEAFRDLPRFASRSPLRIWLFGIARHRVLDAAKQRGRHQHRLEALDMLELPDAGPSPIDAIDDARLLEALTASLGELDERVRTALLLHYQHGFTFDEMAVICREKAGTLNARVARALPRLRACIEARLQGRHAIGRCAERADKRARWNLFDRAAAPGG